MAIDALIARFDAQQKPTRRERGVVDLNTGSLRNLKICVPIMIIDVKLMYICS